MKALQIYYIIHHCTGTAESEQCLLNFQTAEQGSDHALTTQWATIKPYIGGSLRSVRCALPFQAVIDENAPRSFHGRDTVDMLLRILQACVPCARQIFTGSFAPLRLLHMNDYVIEKTFVYAVIALSKWLGSEAFPCGIYGQWPPKAPSDLVPKPSALSQGDCVMSATSSAAPIADSDLPPHLRVGAAASSSTSGS